MNLFLAKIGMFLANVRPLETDENGVAAFESSIIDAAMASLDGSTAEVKITVTTEDYKAFETEAVIVKNNTSANVNITKYPFTNF